MKDIFLDWGGDLEVSASGDVRLVSGPHQSDQRVVRRLLTNACDYIWHVSYGGGLALAIGEPMQTKRIEAVVRAQLQMEAVVPPSPAPVIDVHGVDPASGSFVVQIRYGGTGEESNVAVKVQQDSRV